MLVWDFDLTNWILGQTMPQLSECTEYRDLEDSRAALIKDLLASLPRILLLLRPWVGEARNTVNSRAPPARHEYHETEQANSTRTGTVLKPCPSRQPSQLQRPAEPALRLLERNSGHIRPNCKVLSSLSTNSQCCGLVRLSWSADLDHFIENWFEIFDAAKHERVHSQCALAVLSATTNGTPWSIILGISILSPIKP